MNKSLSLLMFLVFGLTVQAQVATERNCWTMDHLHEAVESDPLIQKNIDKIQEHAEAFEASYNPSQKAAVITIPTVVHVLYNNSSQNISDAQIQSQLTILNQDFRRTNPDASSTPSAFAGVAADTDIEFCLATTDPNGNASTGVTRTSTSVSAFSTGSGCGSGQPMKFDAYGGKDAWPADQYLNMWVCALGGGTLGYAQFPGSGCAATDGVVIGYNYFGTIGTASSPFDGGRTTTHEVGHWLNLRHIWGDGNCSADDFVSDTPTSDAANYGCATGHVSCSSTDMVQNYMDYSDDYCMNLFTEGQKTRMRAVLESGGYRSSLLNSNGCGSTTPVSCDIPSGLSATPANDQATMAWTAVSSASSYTIRARQVGSTSWSSGSVTGTSVNYTGLTACTNYEFQVEAVCGSTTSGYSSSSTFTTTGCTTVGYCASQGNSVADEWINSVSLASINNTSGANGGYADFTSQSTDLEQGVSYTANLSPGFTGSAYNEYWKIWIDYNSDDDFDDAGELVYDAGGLNNAAVTANITISASAPLGSTRMRVSMKYNGAQTSCEAFDYGEVEDYTVNIIAPVATACDVPSGLSATPTDDTAALSWSSASGATSYTLRARQIGSSAWASGTTTGTALNYTGLSACTDYEFQVESTCAGTTSGYSSSFTFTTTGCTTGGGTYCTLNGNSVADEWIQNVSIGSISNNSGVNGGYADFTAQSTNLSIGTAEGVSLSPGYTGTAYPEHWRIWIDLNQDYDFDDAGEMVYDDAAGTAVSTGTITVPTGSLTGNTRMRIAMKYFEAADPGGASTCGTFNFGEVEDYTVNIIAPIICNDPSSLNATANDTDANISWSGTSSASSYSIQYRVAGTSSWSTASATSSPSTVSGLSTCSDYEYRVRANCGSTNSSYSAISIFATTGCIQGICASSGNQYDTNFEWISNLNFVTINNNSGNSGGYADFTSVSTDVEQGQAYSVQITPSFANNVYDQALAIYIDFNQDDELDATTELAFNGTSIAGAAISGTINIPANAHLGSLLMRVSMKANSSNGYPPPCGTFHTGEVEDYSINVLAPGSNGLSYCDSKGNSISDEWIASVNIGSLSNATGANGGYADFTSISGTFEQGSNNPVQLTPGFSGQEYNEYWKIWVDFNQDGDFSDAGELAYDASAASNTTVTGVLSIPATALLGDTRMRVTMKYLSNTGSAPTPCETFDYGEVEDYTATIIASSGGGGSAPTGYCAMTSTNTTYEWIESVSIGSINNASGNDGGYGDYTNLSTSLTAGSTASITMSPGYASGAYNEQWTVYVDWNRDGDFADAGETAVSNGPSQSAVTSTFTVPTSASNGITRMRVVMRYNNAADGPCNDFTYGEVEDYHLSISGGTLLTVNPALQDQQIKAEADAQNTINDIEVRSELNSSKTELAATKITAYPNPAQQTSTLNIEWDKNEAGLLSVYLVNGQQLISETLELIPGTNSVNLNVADWNSGYYLVRLQTESNSTTIRLIVNH